TSFDANGPFPSQPPIYQICPSKAVAVCPFLPLGLINSPFESLYKEIFRIVSLIQITKLLKIDIPFVSLTVKNMHCVVVSLAIEATKDVNFRPNKRSSV